MARKDWKALVQKAIDHQQAEKARIKAQAVSDEANVDSQIAVLQGVKGRLNSGRLTEDDLVVLFELLD